MPAALPTLLSAFEAAAFMQYGGSCIRPLLCTQKCMCLAALQSVPAVKHWHGHTGCCATPVGPLLQGESDICRVHAWTTAPRPLRPAAKAGHQRPHRVQPLSQSKTPQFDISSSLSAAITSPAMPPRCTQPRYLTILRRLSHRQSDCLVQTARRAIS